MSISHHFYRKRPGFAILTAVALLGSTGFAQSRNKEKGPRALAVVELPAGAKAKPRLTPITILVNGRFWDASIYLADPRPLALDAGNVYEVERSGKPVGTFVVKDASQVQDRWFAFGDWQPASEKAAFSRPAKSGDADDERPVLHKSQTTPSAQEAHPTAEVKPTAPAPPPPDDPNRPVLRRGKPKTQPEESVEQSPEPETSSKANADSQPAPPNKPGEVLPAISDADGPEPRSYAYPWGPDEQQKLTKEVSDIAIREVTQYARSTPALRFAPAASSDQVATRAFDLQFDNNPEVVFTARVPAVAPPAAHVQRGKPEQPPPGFFFYVTVVGRTDLYGQMRKLFSSVTDSAHLDVFPRLELVDAVDAEGTGRGDLLFRSYSGSDTPGYQLYHVGPDSLRKLFDSAGQ